MIKLINNIPFFYVTAFIFILVSQNISKLTYMVVLWGLYIFLNVYLYLFENIVPAIWPFLIIVVSVFKGPQSPLMPLLFLALPYIHKHFEKHFLPFSIASLLSLVLTGDFSNKNDFFIYLLFIISSIIVYFLGKHSIWDQIFATKKKVSLPVQEKKENFEIKNVQDPFFPLKNFIEKTEIINNIPVSITLVELVNYEKAKIFNSEQQKLFSIKGLLIRAIKDKTEIACKTLLNEREDVPRLPEFNTRVYMPINPFKPYDETAQAEFVLVVDAKTDMDRNLLPEKFKGLKRDIIELIRTCTVFDNLNNRLERTEKMYKGTRKILESLEKEKLYEASAWSVFNIVSGASAVLITEIKNNEHRGYLFKIKRFGNEDLKLENIYISSQGEITDKTTIPSLMIEGKIGKIYHTESINSRDEQNKLFIDEPFKELNEHFSMHTFLLSHNNSENTLPTIFGTLNIFTDEIAFAKKIKENTESLEKEDPVVLISKILSTALSNISMFEKVQQLSNTDGLTGLFNRRYFDENLQRMILESTRSKNPLSVIMIDIDFFKKVNDTYGHKAGDKVLSSLSKAIKNKIRKVDLAARYGGEEFIVILPNTSKEGAIRIAEKFQLMFKGVPINFDSKQIYFTLSMGVSTFPDCATNAENLVKTADAALYYSKENGRNRITFYDEEIVGKIVDSES